MSTRVSMILRFLLTLLPLVSVHPWSLNAQVTDNPDNFHIYLLLGQSNMEGGSSIDGPMDKDGDPRILKLNRWNSWQVALDPITNNKSEAVGPGLAFAKKMIEHNPDVTVGLVPLAVGGTPIAAWMRGSANYQRVLQAAAVARHYGTLKGILWHQGEHDSIYPDTALAYADNLATLIDDVRKDLQDPNLSFVVGGLVDGISNNRAHVWAYYVINRLKHIGTTFYRTGYARSSELPYLRDNLHFSTEGMRVMGERYAEVQLRLNGEWLEKGRQLLEESSTELENGWKSSPMLGRYLDTHFPYVKQAQLGWIRLDFFGDYSMSIRTATMGTFRSYPNNSPDGIYIYRENPDPELINEPSDVYFIRFGAEDGDPQAVYSHNISAWKSAMDETRDQSTMDGVYYLTEDLFIKTQIANAELQSAAASGARWSEVTHLLRETEFYRILTILQSVDAYHFALDAYKGMPKVRDFWLTQTSGIIDRIDSVLLEAQVAWIEYTEQLLQ